MDVLVFKGRVGSQWKTESNQYKALSIHPCTTIDFAFCLDTQSPHIKDTQEPRCYQCALKRTTKVPLHLCNGGPEKSLHATQRFRVEGLPCGFALERCFSDVGWSGVQGSEGCDSQKGTNTICRRQCVAHQVLEADHHNIFSPKAFDEGGNQRSIFTRGKIALVQVVERNLRPSADSGPQALRSHARL